MATDKTLMGTWGTSLFSDDTAADTRDTFRHFVAKGLDAEQATARVLEMSGEELQDSEEAAVFWLALAATQWKLGRLLPTVRDRALELLASGADLGRWEGSRASVLNQRKQHLEKLRQQLLISPPKPRKLKRPPTSSTDFQVGDVAHFSFEERRAIRFVVLRKWDDSFENVYTDICLLGLDQLGEPFDQPALALTELGGPRFTMMSHEPAERITLLARGIGLPADSMESRRAFHEQVVPGWMTTWDRLPEDLGRVLPQLGWV